jgi:nucleoside-diphosphate-sugar epimerase
MPAEKIAGEIFNAGYQNQTVNELAQIAKAIVEEEFPEKKPIRIERTSSDDNRSYRITSRKIAERLGWGPKRTIEDAVRDLCRAFKENKFPGNTLTDESFINVKTVKALSLS